VVGCVVKSAVSYVMTFEIKCMKTFNINNMHLENIYRLNFYFIQLEFFKNLKKYCFIKIKAI